MRLNETKVNRKVALLRKCLFCLTWHYRLLYEQLDVFNCRLGFYQANGAEQERCRRKAKRERGDKQVAPAISGR